MNKARWKTVFSLAVTVIVLTFVVIAFWKPLQELEQYDIRWEVSWLVFAGVVYIAGLAFSVTFWWISLRRLGQHPPGRSVVWAYYLGHLAKYVPGKALVVVVRTLLIRGPKCRGDVAAVTVVYETFLYMAVGAVLAGVVVAVYGPLAEHLQSWHVALLLAGLVPLVIPWVFNAVMSRLTAPFRRLPEGGHTPLPKFGLGLLGTGILLQTMCCVFVALSLAAVIRSVRPEFDLWSNLPALTAKFSAAMVLGFIIPTPAGLGTREYALKLLLEDDLGSAFAALVPLLTRLTWLIAECVAVAILWPLRFQRSHSN
jgi:glycosyltransferase 2 family protein